MNILLKSIKLGKDKMDMHNPSVVKVAMFHVHHPTLAQWVSEHVRTRGRRAMSNPKFLKHTVNSHTAPV